MSTHSSQVQNQNLRECSVQILDGTGATRGTGIIVSEDGKVVTCTHVLRLALQISHAQQAEQRPVTLLLQKDTEKRHAVIIAYLSEYEDDIVLLQMVNGQFPLPASQVAVLGHASDSKYNSPFLSYGFRSLPPYHDGWAGGKIRGSVNPPPGKRLQYDPLQIRSDEIDEGMSGAAVLDTDRNLIVGVVSQSYRPLKKSTKDRYTAWAVDASVLALPPFNLSVRDTPLPRKSGEFLHMNTPTIRATARKNPGSYFYNTPEPLTTWVGRSDLLETLNEKWTNQDYKVTSIIGVGGEGKTSLVREWLELLLNDPDQPAPDGVFWWDFNLHPNPESFFHAALEFIWNGWVPEGMLLDEITDAPEQFLGAMLGAGRYLFILDGLENIQYDSGNQFSSLKYERLTKFLRLFASLTHQSHCIATSRLPLVDMMIYSTHCAYKLSSLDIDEGSALLRRLGVTGSDAELEEEVAKRGGYALALNQIGILLRKEYDGNVAAATKLPIWSPNDASDDQIHKILHYYEDILSLADRTLLMLCSVFRASIPTDALIKIFHSPTQNDQASLPYTSEAELDQAVLRLLDYAILRKNEQGEYTLHSLFQAYYSAQLAVQPPQIIHEFYILMTAYYDSKAETSEKLASDTFSSISIEIESPTQRRTLNTILNGMARSGSLWARRAAGTGDLRAAIIGSLLGYIAGAAVGGIIGILAAPDTWKSSAKSIQLFQQSRQYKREAYLYQQEANYYRESSKENNL